MTQAPTLVQDRIHEGTRLLHELSKAAKMGGNLRSMLTGLAFSFCLYACYKVFIYPFYISPLRKVPEPSVRNSSLLDS